MGYSTFMPYLSQKWPDFRFIKRHWMMELPSIYLVRAPHNIRLSLHAECPYHIYEGCYSKTVNFWGWGIPIIKLYGHVFLGLLKVVERNVIVLWSILFSVESLGEMGASPASFLWGIPSLSRMIFPLILVYLTQWLTRGRLLKCCW